MEKTILTDEEALHLLRLSKAKKWRQKREKENTQVQNDKTLKKDQIKQEKQ